MKYHGREVPVMERLYWFCYDHFGREWNDFKDFIGRPSDPLWLREFCDRIGFVGRVDDI